MDKILGEGATLELLMNLRDGKGYKELFPQLIHRLSLISRNLSKPHLAFSRARNPSTSSVFHFRFLFFSLSLNLNLFL